MTNEFEFEGMTDEQLADYHLQKAIEHANATLRMNENCYQKFDKQLLSETQKNYFENIAKGILPTDEEQIAFDIESVEQARKAEMQRKTKQGADYMPLLLLEDKTDGLFC